MPVTTTTAAVHITPGLFSSSLGLPGSHFSVPVVIKTLLLHSKRKVKRIKDSRREQEAQDDLLFDE